MSYRNPKIITPPNYGEIFAKNMQYGASMVSNALRPVLTALEKQKKTKERMAASTAGFEQNIRSIVNSKAGSFEKMTEAHLAKNADAWYENERLYANGKITAKEYNGFKSNMTTEIYDAAGAMSALNETVQYMQSNSDMLASSNNVELVGLKEAIEDPDKYNYQMKRNEEGKTVLSYKDLQGNEVSFDYADLAVLRKEDILLQNNYAMDGAMGKKITALGLHSAQNMQDMISKPKPEIKIDKKAGTQTIKTYEVLDANDRAQIKNTGYQGLLNGVVTITNAELETHYLDKQFAGDFEGGVGRSAISMAQKFNIENVEELAKLLKTPFKKDLTIKNRDGEDINISKIAYNIAEEDILNRAIDSVPTVKKFFDAEDGRVQTGEETKEYTPSVDEDALARQAELEALFNNSIKFLNSAKDYDIFASANKDQKDVGLSEVYNMDMDNYKAVEDYIWQMGFELKKTTSKVKITQQNQNDYPGYSDGDVVELSGVERKKDSNKKPYYVVETNRDAVGAKVSTRALKEFRLSSDTSIFDLLSYRLQLQDVIIKPSLLQEKFQESPEDLLAFMTAEFMGGSYNGFTYKPQ